METKRCTKCGEVKELEEFSPQVRGKLGRTARCKACGRAHAKAKLKDEAYAETSRQRCRDWHRDNQEARREYDARRLQDPAVRDRRRAVASAWQRANPERPRLYASRRRASLAAATVEDFNHEDVMADWSDFELWACYFCGGSLADGYHVDHFQALANGGAHGVYNLVPSCPACNLSKGARDEWAFLRNALKDRGIDLDDCLAQFDDSGRIRRRRT